MITVKLRKLSNPYLQACVHLELSRQEGEEILGCDVNLLDQQTCFWFYPNYKTRKTATSIIQIYIHLFVFSSGNLRFIAHWFKTQNNSLRGIPRELVKTSEGRTSVLDYLNQGDNIS